MNIKNNLQALQKKVSTFSAVRNWECHHSPKNLSMALSAETGELLEIFQWLSEEESDNLPAALREQAELEIADVFMYMLLLCERLNIDLEQVTNKKLAINEQRF